MKILFDDIIYDLDDEDQTNSFIWDLKVVLVKNNQVVVQKFNDNN